MKLEDQVCSLELAKRLEELLLDHESYFCWYSHENPPYGIFHEDDVVHWVIGVYKIALKGGADWIYPAFTVAELGEMLPDNICFQGTHPNLFIAKGTKKENFWTIGYSDYKEQRTTLFTECSEADARAKMLIYLLENGLIKEQDNAASQRKESK